MKQFWWVKFENQPPSRHCYDDFVSFWENLKTIMLSHPNLKLEWIIRD